MAGNLCRSAFWNKKSSLKHCPDAPIRAWEALGNILPQVLLRFLFHPCVEKNPGVPCRWKLHTRVPFKRNQEPAVGTSGWPSGVTAHPRPSGLVTGSGGQRLLWDEFRPFDLRNSTRRREEYSLQEWLRAGPGTMSWWWQDWEGGLGWVPQAWHHQQHQILNCFPCKMSTFWFLARNRSSRRWEQISNLISSNEVNSFWIEELSWKLWQFITCSKLIKLQGRRKDQKIACYWHN